MKQESHSDYIRATAILLLSSYKGVDVDVDVGVGVVGVETNVEKASTVLGHSISETIRPIRI